jgi:hypothetical protein
LSLDYGLIGAWMLVVGVVAIVVEGVLAAIWSLRISRKALALSERLAEERGRVEADVERLRQAIAETEVLWQPFGRLLRWLNHPIAIALLRAYARRTRRAAAR